MQAHKVARWVIKDISAHSGEGKCHDLGVKVCKEGNHTDSTYFYMYSGAEYMRMPSFWNFSKVYHPLGILSWDPMAST